MFLFHIFPSLHFIFMMTFSFLPLGLYVRPPPWLRDPSCRGELLLIMCPHVFALVRVGYHFQTVTCLQPSALRAAAGQAIQRHVWLFVLFGPLSSGLRAFISMFSSRSRSPRSAVPTQLSEDVLQRPLRPTNYGLWLFPFCFTESGTIARRRAGRKASATDCLSFRA